MKKEIEKKELSPEEEAVKLEQLRESMRITKRRYENDVITMKRAVVYKIEQIKSGKLTETSNLFVEDVKPLFVLRNEIDTFNVQIKEKEEQIKEIEAQEVKHAGDSTKS